MQLSQKCGLLCLREVLYRRDTAACAWVPHARGGLAGLEEHRIITSAGALA